MPAEDVPSLMQVLDPALTQNAQFVTDPNRDMLIVWATPKYQAAVKNAVDEFRRELPEPIEPISRVYRFKRASPTATTSGWSSWGIRCSTSSWPRCSMSLSLSCERAT